MGVSLPLGEWSEAVEVSGRDAVVSPDAVGCVVEVEWRDGGGEWSQAALREMCLPWVELRVRALEGFRLEGFEAGKRDLRFVSLVRGGVAAYGVDVDFLELGEGEEVVLKARALVPGCGNVLFGAGEFVVRDRRMVVENVGASRGNFREVGGPAVAEAVAHGGDVFVVGTGESEGSARMDELMKGV